MSDKHKLPGFSPDALITRIDRPKEKWPDWPSSDKLPQPGGKGKDQPSGQDTTGGGDRTDKTPL